MHTMAASIHNKAAGTLLATTTPTHCTIPAPLGFWPSALNRNWLKLCMSLPDSVTRGSQHSNNDPHTAIYLVSPPSLGPENVIPACVLRGVPELCCYP